MTKLSRTWSLMSSSWEILKKDKEIIVFPIFSGIACLMVMASFAYPIYLGGLWQSLSSNARANDQHIAFYGILFLFYFCNYFVIVFFNSGIVACAAIRMQGGDPTVSDGLKTASSRIGLIAGWAFVLATVGVLLRLVEQRSRKIGQVVASLLGLSWSIASFLVVPILVIEGKGPIDALKESAALLKKSWGEQLMGNFSFGLVFLLLSLPAFFVIGFAVHAGFSFWMLVFILLAVEYLILLALIQSTLQAIFQAAVYAYAHSGSAPEGFRHDEINDALRRK
ncbi:MAG: DUF6159 family protein [Desulfoferrobacter sp.]